MARLSLEEASQLGLLDADTAARLNWSPYSKGSPLTISPGLSFRSILRYPGFQSRPGILTPRFGAAGYGQGMTLSPEVPALGLMGIAAPVGRINSTGAALAAARSRGIAGGIAGNAAEGSGNMVQPRIEPLPDGRRLVTYADGRQVILPVPGAGGRPVAAESPEGQSALQALGIVGRGVGIAQQLARIVGDGEAGLAQQPTPVATTDTIASRALSQDDLERMSAEYSGFAGAPAPSDFSAEQLAALGELGINSDRLSPRAPASPSIDELIRDSGRFLDDIGPGHGETLSQLVMGRAGGPLVDAAIRRLLDEGYDLSEAGQILGGLEQATAGLSPADIVSIMPAPRIGGGGPSGISPDPDAVFGGGESIVPSRGPGIADALGLVGSAAGAGTGAIKAFQGFGEGDIGQGALGSADMVKAAVDILKQFPELAKSFNIPPEMLGGAGGGLAAVTGIINAITGAQQGGLKGGLQAGSGTLQAIQGADAAYSALSGTTGILNSISPAVGAAGAYVPLVGAIIQGLTADMRTPEGRDATADQAAIASAASAASAILMSNPIGAMFGPVLGVALALNQALNPKTNAQINKMAGVVGPKIVGMAIDTNEALNSLDRTNMSTEDIVKSVQAAARAVAGTYESAGAGMGTSVSATAFSRYADGLRETAPEMYKALEKAMIENREYVKSATAELERRGVDISKIALPGVNTAGLASSKLLQEGERGAPNYFGMPVGQEIGADFGTKGAPWADITTGGPLYSLLAFTEGLGDQDHKVIQAQSWVPGGSPVQIQSKIDWNRLTQAYKIGQTADASQRALQGQADIVARVNGVLTPMSNQQFQTLEAQGRTGPGGDVQRVTAAPGADLYNMAKNEGESIDWARFTADQQRAQADADRIASLTAPGNTIVARVGGKLQGLNNQMFQMMEQQGRTKPGGDVERVQGNEDWARIAQNERDAADAEFRKNLVPYTTIVPTGSAPQPMSGPSGGNGGPGGTIADPATMQALMQMLLASGGAASGQEPGATPGAGPATDIAPVAPVQGSDQNVQTGASAAVTPTGDAAPVPNTGSFRRGGTVPSTGTYELHAGEVVLPADRADEVPADIRARRPEHAEERVRSAPERWYVDLKEGTPTQDIADPTAPTVRRLVFSAAEVTEALEAGEAPIMVNKNILSAPPSVLFGALKRAQAIQNEDVTKSPAVIAMKKRVVEASRRSLQPEGDTLPGGDAPPRSRFPGDRGPAADQPLDSLPKGSDIMPWPGRGLMPGEMQAPASRDRMPRAPFPMRPAYPQTTLAPVPTGEGPSIRPTMTAFNLQDVLGRFGIGRPQRPEPALAGPDLPASGSIIPRADSPAQIDSMLKQLDERTAEPSTLQEALRFQRQQLTPVR